MTRARHYETMDEAIGQLERIDTLDGFFLLVLKLRKNQRILQTIVTLAASSPVPGGELSEALKQARMALNGIIPVLRRALLWRCLCLSPHRVARRRELLLEHYNRAREQMSWVISLVDPTLADDFDACSP